VTRVARGALQSIAICFENGVWRGVETVDSRGEHWDGSEYDRTDTLWTGPAGGLTDGMPLGSAGDVLFEDDGHDRPTADEERAVLYPDSALAHPMPGDLRAAVETILASDPPSRLVNAIFAALQPGPRPRVRIAAASVFRDAGSRFHRERTENELKHWVKDPDPAVSLMAAVALASTWPLRHVPHLAERLRVSFAAGEDPDYVRKACAAVTGEAALVDDLLRDVLAAARDAAAPRRRACAAGALAAFATNRPEAARALGALLQDSDGAVRADALEQSARLDPLLARPFLERARQDADLRARAEELLRRLDRSA